MLKSLGNFSLMDLLPESLTRDPTIRACIEGLDEELRKLTADISETLIISRIDEISEDVIDLLAWQFDVPFYQPAELDIATKRSLVKNAIADHRIRGTPAAVEKLLTQIFKGAEVKEWWEFNGDPYTFRIEQLGRSLATEQDFKDFELALDVAKNVRSHLESFTVIWKRFLEIFYGFVNLRVENRSKLYRPELIPSTLEEYLGFIDVKSVDKKFPYRLSSIAKPSINYIGFINQQHIERKSPWKLSDKPIHDLRSTAILDLLILGLGILRECGLPPKPIWNFISHELTNYIGFINARTLNRDPSNLIRLNFTSLNTFGILKSKTLENQKLPSLTFNRQLALHWYIFATKIVMRYFGAKVEDPISATINRNSILTNFFAFARFNNVSKFNTPRFNIDSEIKSYIGLINMKSISASKILETTITEPIIYHRSSILNFVVDFARFLSVYREIRNIPEHKSTLPLYIGGIDFKSVEKSKSHKITPIKSMSDIFIGAIHWKKISRTLKSDGHDLFNFRNNELQIFFDFARFKYVKRQIFNRNIDSSSNFNLYSAVINFKSIWKENLEHTQSTDDRIIHFDNSINLFVGLARISNHSKQFSNSYQFNSQILSYIGAVKFKSIYKTNPSKDTPSISDESIARQQTLNFYFDFVRINALSRQNIFYFDKHSTQSVSIALIPLKSLDFKYSYPSTFNHTMNLNVASINFRSLVTSKTSNFRLQSITAIESNFNIYQGFVRVSARSNIKRALSHFNASLNTNIGCIQYRIVRRENHSIERRILYV